MVNANDIVWLSFSLVAYTYFGYPFLIWLLSRTRSDIQVSPAEIHQWPDVTIIIPVFNERSRISGKIANLDRVDYPRDRLQILFVSDGSTDGTAEEIAGYAHVELVAYGERKGKPHALNMAVARAAGRILVFSDARQDIESSSVKYLVTYLQREGIGAVSGELVHTEPGTHQAASIGLYWRYEKFIRKAESRFYSTLGVTGALYAIHRKDYMDLKEDTLLDDFEVPVHILRHGRRSILAPQAVVYDVLQQDSAGEHKRKVRTLTGNYQSFARNPWLFSPFANPAFFQFVSHKVLRLVVPYALCALLVSSAMADGDFYRIFFYAQVLFYVSALTPMLIPALKSRRLLSFMSVFVSMNWSAVSALLKYVTSNQSAKWEKT
jgi:cellulose synthase/poly-beta-1,6-N-acetylglucosamine synthase-like glycosyltransferase